MDDDIDGDLQDTQIENFDTYEQYLDNQITHTDLFYLEDQELARQLIELTFHGKGDTITHEQFMQRKQAQSEAAKNRTKEYKALASDGCPQIEGDAFLMELRKREAPLKNGRMTTILFLRKVDEKKKTEVSGYIDLADRLKKEDFKPIFMKKKILMPKETDLSYYNWDGQKASINDSPNFRTDANSDQGLLFRNKRDRKVICVNPEVDKPGDDSTRTEIQCEQYTQVVFFDHHTRRKH